MLLLLPLPGDQQLDIATMHVDCPMQNPFAAIARDRHLHLFALVTVHEIEGRSFRHDGFIEHEQERTPTLLEPSFEPPFD